MRSRRQKLEGNTRTDCLVMQDRLMHTNSMFAFSICTNLGLINEIGDLRLAKSVFI